MEIRVLEEKDLNNWVKYWEYFRGNVFLSPNWLKAFTTPTRRPIFFRFIMDGKTVGLVAGLSIKSRYFVLRRLTKRLFFFTGPTVYESNPELAGECLEKLRDHAYRNGYIDTVFGSYDYPFELDIERLGYVRTVRRECIIDLSRNIDELRNGMNTLRKREIRKAIGEGLRFFETESLPAVKGLLSCMGSTRNRRITKGLGSYSYYYMPYLSDDIIPKILENEVGKIYEVRIGSSVVSSNLTLLSSCGAYYLLGGTTTEGYKLGASSFIVSSIMATLKEQGIQYYNMGGIPTGAHETGLAMFKKSFGAEEKSCTGGSAEYLQGPMLNLLAKTYRGILKIKESL